MPYPLRRIWMKIVMTEKSIDYTPLSTTLGRRFKPQQTFTLSHKNRFTNVAKNSPKLYML
jgi:hypothetical protein